jgi:uncharacterized surface protein with fasciclin (FAS1) repeats
MRALHVLFYVVLIACGSSQHGGGGGSSTCVDDLVDHNYVHGAKGRHNDPEDIAQRLCATYPPDEIVAAKAIVDAKFNNNLAETVRMIHGLRPDQVACAKKEYVDLQYSQFIISPACRDLPQPAGTAPAPVVAAAGGEDVIVVLTKAGKFTKFLKLVEAGHLTEKLKTVGPFTVFAPTDDAFAKLSAGAYDGILTSSSQLERAVPYHIVVGRFPTTELPEPKSKKTNRPAKLPTLTGHNLIVEKNYDNSIAVAGGRARVVEADMAASNGLVNAVDTWLQP